MYTYIIASLVLLSSSIQCFEYDLMHIVETYYGTSNSFIREKEKVSVNMTSVLQEIEQKIPDLLRDRTKWKSYLIDYQPPYLMRIFCDVYCEQLQDTVRVNLHYFYPTTQQVLDKYSHTIFEQQTYENLYHPHAWASCMRILNGVYDQWIGFASQAGLTIEPEKIHRMTLQPGDSYAMNHPWLWHQVIPRPDQAVSTIMVTYIPLQWDQDAPKSTKRLRSLSEKELDFMFSNFAKHFSL